jgi:hypothetical protein
VQYIFCHELTVNKRGVLLNLVKAAKFQTREHYNMAIFTFFDSELSGGCSDRSSREERKHEMWYVSHKYGMYHTKKEEEKAAHHLVFRNINTTELKTGHIFRYLLVYQQNTQLSSTVKLMLWPLSRSCLPHVHDATTTCPYQSSLRWVAATPDMEEYLLKHNQ